MFMGRLEKGDILMRFPEVLAKIPQKYSVMARFLHPEFPPQLTGDSVELFLVTVELLLVHSLDKWEIRLSVV